MKVADPFSARKEMAAQVPGGVAVGESTDVTMEDAAAAAEPPEAENDINDGHSPQETYLQEQVWGATRCVRHAP